jgi:hypothetical protein
LKEVILGLGVRVVVDHFGYPEVGSKINNTRNTIDPYRTMGFSEGTLCATSWKRGVILDII